MSAKRFVVSACSEQIGLKGNKNKYVLFLAFVYRGRFARCDRSLVSACEIM